MKKILSALLCMVMIVSLFGCSDNDAQKREEAVEKYGEEFVTEFENLEVGDTYKFGAYEQDNKTSNGKEEIEWRVLAKEGTRILVVSKRALDCQLYNNFSDYTNGDFVLTWENCTLRNWLNNDFFNAAFSDDEKTMIPTVKVPADKNPEHKTNPGNATQDKVFLLSIEEVSKYFVSDDARQCWVTDYAEAMGVHKFPAGTCWYWLRTPGLYQNNATRVDYEGRVDVLGYSFSTDEMGVRPAMWIDLNA